MDWIKRKLEDKWDEALVPGKVLVLYGPRRAGKTSVVRRLLKDYQGRLFMGSGDDSDLRSLIVSESLRRLQDSFAGYDLLFLDEAQRIPNIGLGLKMLVDSFPELRLVATGSSSFDLANRLGEPLTGRKTTRILYPISLAEYVSGHGGAETLPLLPRFLIYGMYPESILAGNDAARGAYLRELADAYLFKDILDLETIRSADKIRSLLKLLAFQIGSEVSIHELSNALGIAKQTVERYLDLLEKSFIIRKVGGYSTNQRKEVAKMKRYYFLDNGVRNAVIQAFQSMDSRNDAGQLWENFCYMERLKRRSHHNEVMNEYFFRTYSGQEIDLIEEADGILTALEFKWNPKKKTKVPPAWRELHPESPFRVVTPENCLEHLT